jgi:hypothetical protein
MKQPTKVYGVWKDLRIMAAPVTTALPFKKIPPPIELSLKCATNKEGASKQSL